MVVTKKRWPDSQHEHLFPWLLPLVLFPHDLYLILQLISYYLSPQTFNLWDLTPNILENAISANIQMVLIEKFS